MRERVRWRVASAAARLVLLADVDKPTEEGAVGEDHRVAAKAHASGADDASGAVALDDKIGDRVLEYLQAWAVLQCRADCLSVKVTVGLGAGGAHCGAVAGVEHAELNSCQIGGFRHDAAEGVDLFYQMAFADAADGGVARHLANGLHALGDEQGLGANARRCQRRFGAGVAATDNDDLKSFRVVHLRNLR